MKNKSSHIDSNTMNAEQLQTKCGDVLLKPPVTSCGNARLLWIQFKEVYPSISIGEQPFKTLIEKHRLPPGAVRVSTAAELDENHGERIRHLAAEYPTGFIFSKGLQAMNICSPLLI